jgi:hypothetical protein
MGALSATRFSAPDLAGLQNFKLTRDLVCHLSFTFCNVKTIGQITFARQRKITKLLFFIYFKRPSCDSWRTGLRQAASIPASSFQTGSEKRCQRRARTQVAAADQAPLSAGRRGEARRQAKEGGGNGLRNRPDSRKDEISRRQPSFSIAKSGRTERASGSA